MSSSEECDAVRPTANSPIVDLNDYGMEEKTIHYIQVKQVIEILKIKNAEAEENLKKAEINNAVYLKTLIVKISVDSKLLKLEISLRNTLKGRSLEKFRPVFS